MRRLSLWLIALAALLLPSAFGESADAASQRCRDFLCAGLHVNLNLVKDCDTYNTTNWQQSGGSGGTGPSYGSLVADPFGKVDAQQVTFSDPRSSAFQIIAPKLAPNKTYTVSVYFKLITGTPNFYLGYYNGATPVAQYSTKIIPTSSWQRTAGANILTFKTGGSDPNPSITFANANVDGASQGNTGTAAIWGIKVEAGSVATAFQGCAGGTPNTRNFFVGTKPGGGGGSNNQAQFLSEQTAIGATIEAVQVYDFASYTVQGTQFGQYGIAPAYMMSIWANSSGIGGVTKNTDVVAGVYDANIQTMLNQAVVDHNAGYNIPIFRIGWEIGHSFAGCCFTWEDDVGSGPSAGTGNNPANYVAAFRHIAAMVRATCPWAMIDFNAVWGAANDSDYYPGDDVVDIVSVDIYVQPQFQPGLNPGTPGGFTTFLGGYGSFFGLTAFDNFAKSTSGPNAGGHTGGSKWMAFPEIGGGAGAPNASYQANAFDPAPWITNFAGWMQARNTRIAYWLWWNGSDSGSTALGASGSPLGAAAYAAMQQGTPLVPIWQGRHGGTPP